jgi:hypothetical protein
LITCKLFSFLFSTISFLVSSFFFKLLFKMLYFCQCVSAFDRRLYTCAIQRLLRSERQIAGLLENWWPLTYARPVFSLFFSSDDSPLCFYLPPFNIKGNCFCINGIIE